MSISLNSPEVKLALVGVSRDCFPIELTRTEARQDWPMPARPPA